MDWYGTEKGRYDNEVTSTSIYQRTAGLNDGMAFNACSNDFLDPQNCIYRYLENFRLELRLVSLISDLS